MKAPWFPFYTGDFLASPTVQDMEAHEVGAYVLLLARSWQSDSPGYLENDDYALRRAARLSVEQWVQSKAAILKKWPLAEGAGEALRYNPRLLKEAEKQVELREKKAEAGLKSAELKAARKLEAARLATERQQTANTTSTPVQIPATGVPQNGNYSQPQPQVSKLTGRQVGGEPASPPVRKPMEYGYDEAPIFMQATFFDYLKSIGYGHVDRGLYLLQIQEVGRVKMITTTDEKWRSFILGYLNNHKRDGKLLLPEPAQVPNDIPSNYRGTTPYVTPTGSTIPDMSSVMNLNWKPPQG